MKKYEKPLMRKVSFCFDNVLAASNNCFVYVLHSHSGDYVPEGQECQYFFQGEPNPNAGRKLLGASIIMEGCEMRVG